MAKACHEAGPCGYVLNWQLTALGVACEVVAPTLVPVKVAKFEFISFRQSYGEGSKAELASPLTNRIA